MTELNSVSLDQAVARIQLQIAALRLSQADVSAALEKSAALSALYDLIDEAGGATGFSNGAYYFKLGKARASATSGVVQAARNWLRAADRLIAKLEKQLL